MAEGKRLFMGGFAAGMLALLVLASPARGAFVTLPNPVPLTEKSLDLLRKANPADAPQWQLVVFGFTRCEDICPRSLENLSRLVKLAREEKVGLGGVFVSVDPDRDTDIVLERYTAPLGENTGYLRLEGEELERFKGQFGVEAVFYNKNKGNEFFYQVDHSSTAFVIDPAGRIRLVFDALEDVGSAEKMLRDNQDFFQ